MDVPARDALRRACTIQSLERGLKLLELIAEQPDAITAKWLSRISRINLSTCYHLLDTLQVAGYVRKENGTQGYVLTDKVSYLNNLVQIRSAVPRKISNLVKALANETHEACYLSRWDGGDVVTSYIAESDQTDKVRSLYVGYRGHAFLRSMGKIILAHIPPAELAQYWATHPPERRTSNSRIEWTEIQEELEHARQRGLAIDEEEYEVDVCGIAAPIFDAIGRIWGAISVAMPRSHYHRRDETLIACLQGQAVAASLSLGYRVLPLEEVKSW